MGSNINHLTVEQIEKFLQTKEGRIKLASIMRNMIQGPVRSGDLIFDDLRSWISVI